MLTVPLKLDKCLPKLLIHFFRVPMNLWKLKLISEKKSLSNIMRHISLYPIIHVHCTVSHFYTVLYISLYPIIHVHCTVSHYYTVLYISVLFRQSNLFINSSYFNFKNVCLDARKIEILLL